MAEHGQGHPALIYLELDLLLSPLLKLEEIPHTLPSHPTPGASLLTCKNHPQPQVVISPLAAVGLPTAPLFLVPNKRFWEDPS